jgi:cobalt/nickel transport system ATP-binding protein
MLYSTFNLGCIDKLRRAETSVEIKNLTFSYPDGRQILHDICLTVGSKEKVALVGPNGAGKSTLLLHLNGILQPEFGTLSVNGYEVCDKNLKTIRAMVGMVFQNPDDQLFSPTVFDDVAFGLLYRGYSGDEVRERVMWALNTVQMEDFSARNPYRLSPGEKKRIALATVLVLEPSVLVLDEPTGGLDPRGRRAFMELIRELPQTMLITTHDLNLVTELSTRTIILDAGCIVADGPTRNILSDATLLEAHGLV